MLENILSPVFALMLITMLVWFLMLRRRISAMYAHKIHPEKLKHRESRTLLPGEVNAAAENFSNLLELPVLFYVSCIVIHFSQLTDFAYMGMAWGFVALRLAHSIIQCSYNKVMHRFYSYLLSSVLLLVLIVRLSFDIML